jgi:ribosomal protein L40E
MCRNDGCAHVNDGSTATCVKCNSLIQPANWMCDGCGSVNYMLRNQCFSCHAGIQPTWLCMGCRTRSSVYSMDCRKCGEQRQPCAAAHATPHPPARPPAARGGLGGGTARTVVANWCGGGGGAGGQPSAAANATANRRAGARRAGDWMCSVCHKLNHGNRTECFACEAPRRTEAELNGVAGHSAVLGDSNWVCRSCAASNFRTRTSCWQCAAQAPRGGLAPSSGIDQAEAQNRPDIAQEGFQPTEQPGSDGSEKKPPAAEKKVWLSREDQMEDNDWVCARCMHKNFRNQKDCFRCFAPKTVAPVSRVVVKPKVKNFKL